MATEARVNNAASASAASAPAPKVFIESMQTRGEDRKVKDFLKICLSQQQEAIPYGNEALRAADYIGLIYEYDNEMLKKLQGPTPAIPATETTPGIPARPATPAYLELKTKFERIANDTSDGKEKCNVVVWMSENKYCDITEEKFKTFLKKVLLNENGEGIDNTLKTVAILIACSSDIKAHKLNTEDQLELGESHADIRNRTYYLGFNGQMHPYGSDFLLCQDFLSPDEIPTRICPTRRTNQNEENSYINSNNLLTRSNAESSERLKCCRDMVEEFQSHFIEGFKGQRKCIRLDWNKVLNRVKNILSKTDRTQITKLDSTVRGFIENPPVGYEVDGTICAGVDNPCQLSDEGIVSPTVKQRVRNYQSVFNEKDLLWGRLMDDLFNGKGDKFDTLYASFKTGLSSEVIKDYINNKKINKIKNNQGRLKTTGVPILSLLMHPKISGNRWDKINKVYRDGGILNNILVSNYLPREYYSNDSILTMLFSLDRNGNLENKNIMNNMLLNTNIDIELDEVFMFKLLAINPELQANLGISDENKNEYKKHFIAFKKGVRNLFSSLLNKVGRIDREDGPTKKNEIKRLFTNVGRLLRLDFFPVLDTKYLPTDTPNRYVDDTNVDPNGIILDNRLVIALRKTIPVNQQQETLYNAIATEIANIREGRAQTLFPNAVANAAAQNPSGGRRKRKATRKQRKNRKSKTRKQKDA